MSFLKKIIDYFRSAKQELTKVTWPSREQTIRYSTLVIIVSLIVAGFFGMLDSGLSKLVTAALVNRQPNPITAPQDTPVETTDTPTEETSEEKTFEFQDLEITTDGGEVTVETETQE